MAQLLSHLHELQHVLAMNDGASDEELSRFLAALTPEDLRANVLMIDYANVVSMIRAYVPGYGPH